MVKAHVGAETRAYGIGLATLGWNLLKQEKWTEAEPILRESMDLNEKFLKKPGAGALAVSPWLLANLQSMLGAALAGQKKFIAAEPLLLAGYAGLKQREVDIPAQGKYLLTDAAERLAQLYDRLGKNDKADEWRKKR